jgi:hypothetical protein
MLFRFSFALALLLPAVARAQLILPPTSPVSWLPGQTDTTAHHWNNFAAPGAGAYPGPFAPDVAAFAPGLPAATLTETTGSGFLTGGGNLYSPGTVLAFNVQIPAYGRSTLPGGDWQTTVFVQTRSLGTEIDYAGLTLAWTAAGVPQSLASAAAFFTQELERTPLGGFGGFAVSRIWGFNVPYSPTGLTLGFAAAGSSLSLDQVRVDTFVTAVPEPGGLILVGSAVVAWGLRRRGPVR